MMSISHIAILKIFIVIWKITLISSQRENCSYPEEQTVYICRVNELTNFNISFMDTNTTVQLTVYCFDNKFNNLPPGKFQQLNNLETLILKYCKINEMKSNVFKGLKSLSTLEIYHQNPDDFLTFDFKMEENIFDSLQNLKKLTLTRGAYNQIDFHDNKLTYLANNIFRNLKQIQTINLSRNLLRFNESSHLFFNLTSLLQLDLSHNSIDSLPPGIFDYLVSLKELNLMNNSLTQITDNNFSFLKSLEELNLYCNYLQNISSNAFNNLTRLNRLDLNDNKLRNIPNMRSLTNLSQLEFNVNSITNISVKSFLGLTKLKHLELNVNRIKKLNNGIFEHTPEVETIDMARNEIYEIETGTFDSLNTLFYLDLTKNNISRMTSLFINVKTKLVLDDNEIESFQFNDIGVGLKTVSLNRNQIRNITNEKNKIIHKLESFYANENQIHVMDLKLFPSSIKKIELRNNKISCFRDFDYWNVNYLTDLNLKNNNLTEINLTPMISNAEESKITSKLSIILDGNILYCSCANNWLVNSFSLRNAPRIIGIDNCKPVSNRIRTFIPTINLKALKQTDMIRKIFKNCPRKCKCFSNCATSDYIIDCFNVTWEASLAKELYLTNSSQIESVTNFTIFFDANTNIDVVIDPLLTKIMSPLFIGRFLYINNSQLTSIKREMFQSVPNLTELHLEQNRLSSLDGNEFNFVTQLEKLYLHQNYLKFLQIKTFHNLVHLTHLTLHENKLTQPQLWNMAPFLTEITLSKNPLKCDCDFVIPFQKWITQTHELQLTDSNETLCNGTLIPLVQYDHSTCNQQSPIVIIVPTVCSFAFLTIIFILLYLYRLEMKVWLYSRYGLRFFYNNDAADEGKIYDAFVSYANEDDEWVMEQLVPNLSGYKLCLHQRDFVAGGFIVDSIVSSVENSCRTVIILSPNYVRSMWCRFEFDTAHIQSMQDRCQRLLVVMLEKVDQLELDTNLHAYLKTNTYLDRNDTMFWNKLKYALPNLRHKIDGNETSL